MTPARSALPSPPRDRVLRRPSWPNCHRASTESGDAPPKSPKIKIIPPRPPEPAERSRRRAEPADDERVLPPSEFWRRVNPMMDHIVITDVTIDSGTVTIRECPTAEGFFRGAPAAAASTPAVSGAAVPTPAVITTTQTDGKVGPGRQPA